MSHPARHERERAVVIGASMAGLCAARVLSDHFTEVLVLDGDELPEHSANRRRVPQGRHFHTLLTAGQDQLVAWFPGIGDELVADGAVQVNATADGHCFQGGGLRARGESDMEWPSCTRALLEHHVRRRVSALANVTIRDRTTVTGLVSADDGQRIVGVKLKDDTTERADLVIDASGRTGRSIPWLKELGYDEPRTDHVTVKIGYSSRFVSTGDVADMDWRFAMVSTDPPTRLGVAFPMEGERFLVTLIGYHDDHAGSDDDSFLAYARSLPSPVIADLLQSGGELSPIIEHKLPSNQWRHVHKRKRAPQGHIFIGDSVASFNPIYGQGMTSAILQGKALADTLARTTGVDARFVQAFHKRAAKPVKMLWQMATSGDFTIPGTTGHKPFGTDFMTSVLGRYMRRIMLAGRVSNPVNVTVLQVVNLKRPPTALFAPGMIWKVIRASRRAKSLAETGTA